MQINSPVQFFISQMRGNKEKLSMVRKVSWGRWKEDAWHRTKGLTDWPYNS